MLMQKGLLAVLLISLIAGAPTAWPDAKDKPATVKLPENWGELVTVKDLTDEISDSASRMGQNLKKPSDFDKFLKNINTEGHLIAVLSELLHDHPEAGSWRTTAVPIQEQGLIVAKAAEAKGGKNFKLAQDAYKKIQDSLKKKEGGDRISTGNDDTTPDWTSLGALADVMKRVEPSYKYIRGKMSSEAAFNRDAETIRHNAAMRYIFAHISPAFRPTEGDMPKLSSAMSTASHDLLEAVKTSDFAKANAANTAINAACNECHKVKRFTKKGSDLDF